MDFPANNPEKPGYSLEFSDEFENAELDLSKWFPFMLPHWSTLEDSAARYKLENGSLKLLIEHNQTVWLKNSDRASNLQTAHYSGAKGSNVGQFAYYPNAVVMTDLPSVKNYTPQFGYFETRIKAVPVVGYHVALWMIGFDAEQAGEIRVFEIHGGNVSISQSRVDYGILAWNDPDLRDECFEDVLNINAAEYHVYGIEWTPTHVDFYVDNLKLRRINQSPQYPMQFMLGVYERPHEILEHNPKDFPRVCEVDYFRGYQPIDGYSTNSSASTNVSRKEVKRPSR
jgi:Glycosyl hydrolases family 16